MILESFAEKYRLKIRRDECGDAVILGRRGQLYIDGGALCLMILNGRPIRPGRLREIAGDGEVWQGDISRTTEGKRVQDLLIRQVGNPRMAIKLAGAKPRRVLTEDQATALRERFATSRAVRSLRRSPTGAPCPALETHGGA